MTTETKHTAGPWMVTGSNADGTSITNEQGASIARWPAGHELMFSDAALIASAPDLLAALQESEQIIKELCQTYRHPVPQATLDRVAAAIKKAKT